MQIEDRTDEIKKESNPIELLARKQYDGDFYFSIYRHEIPKDITKIIRLYSGYIHGEKKYDLILVEWKNRPLLFLGHWNDGVV